MSIKSKIQEGYALLSSPLKSWYNNLDEPRQKLLKLAIRLALVALATLLVGIYLSPLMPLGVTFTVLSIGLICSVALCALYFKEVVFPFWRKIIDNIPHKNVEPDVSIRMTPSKGLIQGHKAVVVPEKEVTKPQPLSQEPVHEENADSGHTLG